MSITTRFAPSPTGALHLGSAYAALVAWRRARAAGGRFLVRLEDIDTSRCRPEFAAAVLEDLVWLGLDWDGPVRVQTQHLAEYDATLATLMARGLLYRCFCTRGDIARAATAPHGPDGLVYPGTCRDLPPDANPGQPHALRLNVAKALAETGALQWEEEGQGRIQCDPAAFGDIVLARRETPASYHLCVTHDDALQGVTLVTRGADLRPATSIHRLLQALMGWPAPRYHHHAVLTDSSGRRLAKRDASTTIRALRAAGLTPGAVLARVDQTGPDGGPPTRAEV
jgi:glutamyl-Q tRNA(Asp) synthetase